MELRLDQVRAADALAARSSLLLVAPMGAGKTVIALTAAHKVLARGDVPRILVLAPSNVARFSWVSEAARWPHLRGLPIRYIGAETPPAKRLAAFRDPAPGITVTSIFLADWLRYEKLIGAGTPFEAVCVDEVSKLRSPRGVLSKMMRKLAPGLKLRWGLTGTPRPTAALDLWAQVQFVSANTAFPASYDKFLREWAEPIDYNGFSWRLRPTREDDFRRIVAEHAHVILPQDAGTLAPVEIDNVLELSAPQASALRRLEKEAVAELDPALVRRAIGAPSALLPAEVVALTRAHAVGLMGQVLQGFVYAPSGENGARIVGNTFYSPPAKYWHLGDMADELDENLLVAYSYVAEQDMLRVALREVAFLSDAPEQAIQAWNAGNLRALALHPASAGHGLNLQFGGRRLVFVGVPWSPELYEQTMFRVARPGQTKQVYVHRIVFNHWLERVRLERIRNALAEQREEIARLHAETK